MSLPGLTEAWPRITCNERRNWGPPFRPPCRLSPLAATNGTRAAVPLALGVPCQIDHVLIQEDISKGERVRQYTVDGLADGKWQQIAEGTAIGQSFDGVLDPK